MSISLSHTWTIGKEETLLRYRNVESVCTMKEFKYLFKIISTNCYQLTVQAFDGRVRAEKNEMKLIINVCVVYYSGEQLNWNSISILFSSSFCFMGMFNFHFDAKHNFHSNQSELIFERIDMVFVRWEFLFFCFFNADFSFDTNCVKIVRFRVCFFFLCLDFQFGFRLKFWPEIILPKGFATLFTYISDEL